MIMNPDPLAELEDERRFLLRSLRDLEAEREAGDVDDADYATLRDGYTARAADVLRAIDAGKAALPTRPAGPWRRRLVAIAVVAAVAAVAGWLVARSSGERLPGQAISGGGPTEEVASLLARARQLSATDPRQAIDLYDQVLERRPEHAEALTYSGWLLVTASTGAGEDVRQAAVAAARDRLERAVAADESYPDAHCFLAVIAGNIDGDAATARDEADHCLGLDPPAQVRDLMDAFLAGLDDS
jgi:hypothetical protein